jgi:hypothetical protein
MLALAVPVITGMAVRRAIEFIHLPRRVLMAGCGALLVGALAYGTLAASALSKHTDQYLFRNAALVFAASSTTPPLQLLAREGAKRPREVERFLVGPPPNLPAERPKNVIFFVIESFGEENVGT